MRIVPLFVAGACLAASPMHAQQTHGNLEGLVVTTHGDPVAARVTVSGPRLQGVRTFSTDEAGRYRFLALPVGMYTVTVNAVGLRPASLANVRVRLGAMSTVPSVALEPIDPVLDPIVITGRADAIDYSTPAFGARLATGEFEVLPTDRSFRDLLRFAPQTVESPHGDGTNIAGSTGIENMYFVDGVNTTDPYLAATSTLLPHDFVQEVQLLTGGYDAEFGRSLGGIINVVTRSGGNAWHGSVFGYFNNHSLTAEERVGVGGRASQGENVYDVGFTLGGPLVRDRLWFFGAYDPTFRNADVSVDRFGLFGESRTDHLFAGKLTWSPRSNTRAVLSVLGDVTRADRVHPGPFTVPDSLFNPGPLLNRYEDGGVTTSLVVTRDVGGRWLLEGAAGYQRRRLFDGPRAGDDSARVATQIFLPGNRAIEAFSGGYGEQLDAINSRFSARVSATRFLDRHTLKAGLEYEGTATVERSANTPPGVILDFEAFPVDPVLCRDSATTVFGACRYAVIYLDPVASNVGGRYPAAYVQDAWRATSRLTVNLGLRWDAQFWIGTDGSVAQRITNEWQPRAGFSYDLSGRGVRRLSGSVGRFYMQTPNRLIATVANGNDVNGFVWYDDNPLAGGQPVAASNAVFCCSIQPEVAGLRGAHYDEVTLGYDALVRSRWRFGVRGVYRTLREAIQPGRCDPFDPTSIVACGPGDAAGLGNPGSGFLGYLDPVKRNYSSLEFRFGIEGDPRYALTASYVLSRNRGNYPGAHDQDQGNFFFPSDNRSYWFAPQMANNTGLLPNDRTHVVKLRGAYVLGGGLTAGGWFTLQSGVPTSRLALLPLDVGLNPTFMTPRGSEGRTPTITRLDLRLGYETARWGPDARMTLDVFNVLNSRRALWVENVYSRRDGTVTGTWGTPRIYQAPRTARLGLDLMF